MRTNKNLSNFFGNIKMGLFIVLFLGIGIQCSNSSTTDSTTQDLVSLLGGCSAEEGFFDLCVRFDNNGSCISCETGYNLINGKCVLANRQILLSFDYSGATSNSEVHPVPPESMIVRPGVLFTLPNIPANIVRESSVFLGWSTTPRPIATDWLAPGSFIIPNDAVAFVPQSILLYATWGQDYRITYDLNGGTGSVVDETQYSAGSPANLQNVTDTVTPPPWATGFFGWGVTRSPTANIAGLLWYRAGDFARFANDTTLYALWNYPITYDCGDDVREGNFPEAPTWTTVREGASLRGLPGTGCVRGGYALIGWSETGELPLIEIMPNRPITLKPVFGGSLGRGGSIDIDGDGLIEIASPRQLCSIRYDLQGTSFKTSFDSVGLTDGCPSTGCRGYELASNINLSEILWVPVGTQENPFNAIFEGNGYMINNANIQIGSSNDVGFFGVTRPNFHVQNLGLRASISATTYDTVWRRLHTVGTLVGFNKGGNINNVHIISEINSISAEYMSGVVGIEETRLARYGIGNGQEFIESEGFFEGSQYNGSIRDVLANVTIQNASVAEFRLGGLAGTVSGGGHTVDSVLIYGNIANIHPASNTGAVGLVGFFDERDGIDLDCHIFYPNGACRTASNNRGRAPSIRNSVFAGNLTGTTNRAFLGIRDGGSGRNFTFQNNYYLGTSAQSVATGCTATTCISRTLDQIKALTGTELPTWISWDFTNRGSDGFPLLWTTKSTVIGRQ